MRRQKKRAGQIAGGGQQARLSQVCILRRLYVSRSLLASVSSASTRLLRLPPLPLHVVACICLSLRFSSSLCLCVSLPLRLSHFPRLCLPSPWTRRSGWPVSIQRWRAGGGFALMVAVGSPQQRACLAAVAQSSPQQGGDAEESVVVVAMAEVAVMAMARADRRGLACADRRGLVWTPRRGWRWWRG